jgi:hypothetical protein
MSFAGAMTIACLGIAGGVIVIIGAILNRWK